MFRVRTVFNGLQGAPYLSTMYFSDSGGLTAANANAAVGAFWSTVDNNLPNTLTWATEPQVATLSLAGVLTGLTPVTPVTGTGTIAAVLHGPAEQGLVQWRTGAFFGGRELRGRTFIPGMSNSTSSSAGAPTLAFQTAVNTACGTLISDPNSELILWSRRNNASSTVLTGNLWAQFAVLRSRRD